MKSHLVNVVDLEMDGPHLIEVGLTTVDLKKMKVLKTYSMPIRPACECGPISDRIYKLTGWTRSKLLRQGEPLSTVLGRLSTKHGLANRLLVVDHPGDAEELSNIGLPRCVINVSDLYSIKYGFFGESYSLEDMLKTCGLEFEGVPHRASWDSLNIARLFLAVIYSNKINYLDLPQK